MKYWRLQLEEELEQHVSPYCEPISGPPFEGKVKGLSSCSDSIRRHHELEDTSSYYSSTAERMKNVMNMISKAINHKLMPIDANMSRILTSHRSYRISLQKKVGYLFLNAKNMENSTDEN